MKANISLEISKKDLLMNYQKWVSYQEGIEQYLLKPAYDIHQEIVDNKGYVNFFIPREEDVFYPFLDYLYQVWGIENAGVRHQEHMVYISVKAGNKPISQNNLNFIEHVRQFIQEGMMHIEGDQLFVQSAYRKINLELPIDLLDQIKKLAEQQNITMSHWVENAIKETSKLEE